MSAQLPKTAPFSPDEIAKLNTLVGRASPLQRAWLSGFLAGADAANEPGSAVHALAAPTAPPRVKEKLLILYASETGNSEGLAMKTKKAAAKLGFDARVTDMGEAKLDQLAQAKNVIVIAATWGEGDPPQRGAEFYRALMGDVAPRLPNVRFGVLALGDSAYINFCETGRKIDERLAALGATRTVDRVDLDLDFAKRAASWTDATLTALAPPPGEAAPAAGSVVHVDFKSAMHGELLPDDDEAPAFDAETPLTAEISEIVNLSGTGSTSESWHIELATDAPGFAYEPGDAIGILPQNDPALAANLAAAVGLGSDKGLIAKLVAERDITTLTRPVIEAYARLTGRGDVAALAKPDQLAGYIADRQVIDLLVEHKEKVTADQLIGLLRPLPARLYSVASSLKAHAGETHLLVSAVRWHSHGRERKGVASTWLAGLKAGAPVKVYVKPNRHFRLPTDTSRPIIMIGAGTGVAPFRAFVEERAETGDQSGAKRGESWLIFGARNFTTDFLYQLEWQEHLANGALTRLDPAFSRDQPEKIYVQNRIVEQADRLRGWVADGAHIYVCGDEKAMAKDVDKAFVDVLGAERLDELRRAGRYQRDVY